MLLQKYLIAIIIYLSYVSFVFSENFGNVSESMSDESVDSSCKNCTAPSLSKGQKWIATEKNLKKMISSASKNFVRYFDPEDSSKISPKCLSSILEITVGLKELKIWAFKFIDATGKIPSGSLSALGDFDGCLNINVTGNFQGKSCILEIIPPLPKVIPMIGVVEDVPELRTHFSPDTVIGSINSMVGLMNERFVIRLALCVPSTCTKDDVEFIAEKALQMTNILVGFDVRVPVCQMKEHKEMGERFIYSSIFIGLAIIFVISGTLIDITRYTLTESSQNKEKSGIFFRIILCFSMYRNTEKLLKQNKLPDAISVFNGMRVISMLWIILCHTYYFIPNDALYGASRYFDYTKNVWFQVVLNGFSANETFFFMGGTLLMYNWMKVKQHNIKMVLYIIFRRYLRLIAPIMFILAFAVIVEKAGSGPLWEINIGANVLKAQGKCWLNLLFINNLFSLEQMCIPWTWYAAVDMQLCIFSLIVLLITKKYPKISLFLLIFSGIAALIVNQLYYDLLPILTVNLPSMVDVGYYMQHSYSPPHVHVISYSIGLAVGYILHYKSKIRISKTVNIIAWLASFTVGVSVVYSGYIWYNINPNPSTATSAAVNISYKALWCLALGWVTISCCTGNGGFANRFLSWSFFAPLAKLTYVNYLSHPIIMIAYSGSIRVPFQADHRTLAFQYLSFVMASFMLAYLLSMLFEAPFIQLDKLLFTRNIQPSNISRDTEKDSKIDCESNGFNMDQHVNNTNNARF